MSNVTGINVEQGSGAEKIWWGIVFCLTGIGAIVGIPMILAGIAQNASHPPPPKERARQAASIRRKERLYGVYDPWVEINELNAKNVELGEYVLAENAAGRLEWGSKAAEHYKSLAMGRHRRIEEIHHWMIENGYELDIVSGAPTH